MSIDYYQNEITLRDYFITKLEDYKSKFSAYDKFPELKQIYENVVTEIDNQITIQTNLKTKAEGAKTTAPTAVSVAQKSEPCPPEKRYPKFIEKDSVPGNELFQYVFGFDEPDSSNYFTQVRQNFDIVDPKGDGYKIMKLTGNGSQCKEAEYELGKFIEFDNSDPTSNISITGSENSKISIMMIKSPGNIGDAVPFATDGKGETFTNNGNVSPKTINLEETIFQAASQINYLEMMSPNVKPSDGIKKYPDDDTQGPAMAMISYPATLYRNSCLTNSDTNQLSSLEGLSDDIKNNKFYVKNGYVRVNKNSSITDQEVETIKSELDEKMKIGVLLDSEIVVTREQKIPRIFEYKKILSGPKTKTSFAWCSAFVLNPNYYSQQIRGSYQQFLANYSNILTGSGQDGKEKLENFKKICDLELLKTYKLTLEAAIKYGKKNVILTLVGGGAFSNPEEDIFNAIFQAVEEYKNFPLNVYLFQRSLSDRRIQLFEQFATKHNLKDYTNDSINPTPDSPQVVNSPISLSEIKKKRKKKEKKKTPEPQNIMMLERKRREEKLMNLMK